jgi:hypothetical protein
MGALVKDPGPPKLGTWVSKQPFDHSICGAEDLGLQPGPKYGWSGQITNEPGASPGMVGQDSGQMTNEPGALRADEETKAQIESASAGVERKKVKFQNSE